MLEKAMENLKSKFRKYLLKRRYWYVLQDRVHLTDYERDQLIPELKSRLNVLIQYFEDIIKICENQKKTTLFSENLSSIINPNGLPSVDINVDDLSEKFFASAIKQAQNENIDDINGILRKYERIEEVGTLGLFLNEINLLCSSLLEVKNKLFLFKIEAYPHMINPQTGQTIAKIPPQYYLTTEPFQITIQNIISVSKATSESIRNWHKQNMNIKAKFLELHNNRITLRNNRVVLLIQLVTIFLAIVLSAFFLSANDPFNLFKQNRELKEKIEILKHENKILKDRIFDFKNKSKNQNIK